MFHFKYIIREQKQKNDLSNNSFVMWVVFFFLLFLSYLLIMVQYIEKNT